MKDEERQKRITAAVFKPTMHYLNHIVLMIEQLGPMSVYSCRCLERSIGQIKKLIRSRVKTGANAGNVIHRLALSSYLKQLSWTPEEELELNTKNKYTGDTYLNPSLDSQSEYQLWEPFIDTTVYTKSVNNTGISLKKLQNSLVRHYTRVLPNFNQQSSLDCSELKIAGRCWSDPSTEYSSIYYRMKSRHDMRGNHIVMFLAPFLK